MEVQISGISKSERNKFLEASRELIANTEGPFRLSRVAGEKNQQRVLFLRERTWGEFFLEKLILTSQEMEDIENETLAALELAFLSLTDEAEYGSEKSKGKSESENMVFLEESQQIIRSSDQDSINDNDNDNDNDNGAGEEISWDINADLCKKLLRFRVLKESESEWVKDENGPEVNSSKKIQTSNGLFTVPRRLSVSTCPALQVIAHNIFVSNVKVGAVRKVERFSPMGRALNAFKVGWSEVKRNLSVGSASFYPVPLKPGLRHVQNLFCFEDDLNRNENNVLAKNDRAFWKKFYLTPCKQLKGSIAMGLYPDYYKKDKHSDGAVPFYSKENIKGAVDAAIELCSEKRSDGYESVSFMFAEMDKTVAEALEKEINSREIGLSNDVKIKSRLTECGQRQEDENPTLSEIEELSTADEQVGVKKGYSDISPEKEFVIRALHAANDRQTKASAKKKLQEISTRVCHLSKEDLAAVLVKLDQSILYASLELVKLGASNQTTPSKPFRPIVPNNLPTPGTNALKLGVRQAMGRRQKGVNRGSMPLLMQSTPHDE